jgi:hypothetical protein
MLSKIKFFTWKYKFFVEGTSFNGDCALVLNIGLQTLEMETA